MHLRARRVVVEVLYHLRRRGSHANCAVGRLRVSTIKPKMLLNRRPRTLFKPRKSLLNWPDCANCVYNLFNTLLHFPVSLLNCSSNSVNNSPVLECAIDVQHATTILKLCKVAMACEGRLVTTRFDHQASSVP